MRAQGMIRLVGFGLLAMLPTISGQANIDCMDRSVCLAGRCCKDNGRCSASAEASLGAGSTASDACECVSGAIADGTTECACENDGDCPGDTCCMANGQCSNADRGSLEGGMDADDVCECNTFLYSTNFGVCGCHMTDDCRGNRCCKADNLCSENAEATVDTEDMADDVCECASGVFHEGPERCGCADDSDCAGDTCCMEDGRCSTADRGSLEGGMAAQDKCECNTFLYATNFGVCGCHMTDDCRGNRCCKADNLCSDNPEATVDVGDMADDVCECASGAFNANRNMCACEGNADCPGDTCCMANGECSTADRGSLEGGMAADDKCECNTYLYATNLGVCGCQVTDDCGNNRCCMADNLCSGSAEATVDAGDMADDVCECASGVFHEGMDRCGCADDSDCAGDTCCMEDGRCSGADVGSVRGGLSADDVCECNTGRYDADLGLCGCNMTRQCTGFLCCTVDNMCSSSDTESLDVGDMATDVCECASGALVDDTCACENDSHCPGDTCCMADSQCSRWDSDSRRGGMTADDECECDTDRFDADLGMCGCNRTGHCAGDLCCKEDNMCSMNDEGSLDNGDAATDACECASGALARGNICR